MQMERGAGDGRRTLVLKLAAAAGVALLTANCGSSQTAGRSINTSLTVVLTLTALFLLGGEAIHAFVLALLIGIVSGTYSSIFNASPLLVWWDERVAARKSSPSARRVA